MRSHASKIRRALFDRDWFLFAGVHTLVDGQFGSTGKGVIAAALAEAFHGAVHWNITNAAPNSGHTFYTERGDLKVVLKQLPTFAVAERYLEKDHYEPAKVMLTNGAVIDEELLRREIDAHGIGRDYRVMPNAAGIANEDREKDKKNVAGVASTGQGVGPAIMRKMERRPVDGTFRYGFTPIDYRRHVIFMEVSQGFSLGLNSGFYPYVTSRECTVAQAFADAGLPPNAHRKTVMAVRTYPIRVGNSPEGGWSGPCYEDQEEITWEQLGQEAEMTTVTGRVRRVFTWSAMQFRHALLANHPDVIFVNFCNYLRPGTVDEWVHENVYIPYRHTLGKSPDAIIMGMGPRTTDLYVWEEAK